MINFVIFRTEVSKFGGFPGSFGAYFLPGGPRLAAFRRLLLLGKVKGQIPRTDERFAVVNGIAIE